MCTNFRAKEQEVLREALLSKLFDRYQFNIECGEEAMQRVKNKVLCIWGLGLGFRTVIKKRWPHILEDD
jgi:hypothetical protein